MSKISFHFGVIILILFQSTNLLGQHSVFDIVGNTSKVVFLGTDFRHAKFVGTSGFTDPDKIQNIYLQEWNSYYLKEYEKYDFSEELHLAPDNYSVSISRMIALNENVSVKDIITNEMQYEISEDLIPSIVKDYDGQTKEGIGIAYIVEDFNSFEAKANIFVVFLDLSNNEAFFIEKVTTDAGGIGFRNYWLRAIYNIQEEYFPVWYKKWKKDLKKK